MVPSTIFFWRKGTGSYSSDGGATHLHIYLTLKDHMLSQGNRPEIGDEEIGPHPPRQPFQSCKIDSNSSFRYGDTDFT